MFCNCQEEMVFVLFKYNTICYFSLELVVFLETGLKCPIIGLSNLLAKTIFREN